jgi:hypothetical protein
MVYGLTQLEAARILGMLSLGVRRHVPAGRLRASRQRFKHGGLLAPPWRRWSACPLRPLGTSLCHI